jgi:hypothetical protein
MCARWWMCACLTVGGCVFVACVAALNERMDVYAYGSPLAQERCARPASRTTTPPTRSSFVCTLLGAAREVAATSRLLGQLGKICK